jgi:hypothetical protein
MTYKYDIRALSKIFLKNPYFDNRVTVTFNCFINAKFSPTGQVCSNASKVLVHRDVLGEFTKLLITRTENLLIGVKFWENGYRIFSN